MINDLIFKEILKRGYTLEGKTRVWNIADSKLWYLTPKQAQGFLDVEQEESYKKALTQKEVNLIKSHLSKFINMLPSEAYNIVDLGCGDGSKAALFIKEFTKFVDIRYCPIDISSYMVGKAADTIKKLDITNIVNFNWNVSDFENLDNVIPLFRDHKFRHNFFMFLGNTMGNFEGDEILSSVAKNVGRGDFFLIGNGLSKMESQEVNTYSSETVKTMLIEVPKLLGLKEEELEMNARFVDYRTEVLFTVKKDKKIKHLDKVLEFKAGDVIVVFISYKYTKEMFKSILHKLFRKIELYTDEDETYALALCQK